MNELLEKLLSSEILTEEVAASLKEELQAELDALRESVREEESKIVREELVEKWEGERDSLIEALDTAVTEQLKEELAELKQDIEDFRDLEVEYNQRLAQEKAKLKEQLDSDLNELVEHVSDFLELRLQAELNELREDIEEVKKLEFGRKIFETFVSEFKENFGGDDVSSAKDIARLKEELKQTSAQLQESQKMLAKNKHSQRINELTESLVGEAKETMQTVLERVPFERLDETYAKFIGRVLKESRTVDGEGKEKEVLAEHDSSAKTGEDVTVRSGDREDKTKQLNEHVSDNLETIKFWAGINNK